MEKPHSLSRNALALLLGFAVWAALPLAFTLEYLASRERRWIGLTALSIYLAAPLGAGIYALMLYVLKATQDIWLKTRLFAFCVPIVPYAIVLIVDSEVLYPYPGQGYYEPIPLWPFFIPMVIPLYAWVFICMYGGRFVAARYRGRKGDGSGGGNH